MNEIDKFRRGFLAFAGAAAAASLLPRRASAQATAPLNFGYQNTSWGTIGMIAESQETFKKAGANVTAHRFDSGKTTRDAMIAGRIDIGVVGSTPFIIGAAKGELIAIGMAMYAGKTDSIVAGAKSGIKTIADLKGRRVASQLGSATDYVFQNKILPKFGLSKSDIQVVNIPHPNHVAALAAGSVDAFAGVEPFPSVAEVEKLGVVLIDYSQFDLVPVILAANRPVVEGKREAVLAFLRGWLAAVNLFRSDRALATKIVWQHFQDEGFKVSEDVIKVMLGKLDVTPNFVPELKTALDDEAKVLFAQHKIGAVPDWSTHLNSELLQQAAKA